MATTTPNLGLLKPVVGASADEWGDDLNASLDTLDAKVLDKTTGGTVSGAVNVIAATTAPAVRITQTGTGEALRVEDEANPDASPFVIDAAGNVGVGTSTPATKLHLVGNTLRHNDATGSFGYTISATSNTTTLATLFGGSSFAIQTGASGSNQFLLDSAGNLGLGGFAPQPWGSNHKAIEVAGASTGHLMAYVNSLSIGRNYYETNADIRYSFSGQAAQRLLMSDDGQFRFFTAPSGTAGATINFGDPKVSITQGGNLLVGGTQDLGRLTVNNGFVAVDESGIGTKQVYLRSNFAGLAPAIQVFTNDPLLFLTNNTERARITSEGNFRPGADNAYSLGEPTFRWSVVYAATGTINTSDVRAKLDFAPTFGLDFINALEPVSYRYKSGKTVIDQVEDGVEEVPAVLDERGNEVTPATTKPKFKSVERVVEGIRRHHGLKAQQVKSVLDTLGVDFAGWVMDDPSDPDSPQGLRYDQFIAPLIKAVQELSAQNAALESRLAALEQK